MIDWKEVRKDFPITKRFTCLDHASASPMPRPVYEAVLRYYNELGSFADFSWGRWIARREEIRQNIARFIGAKPEEIAFTSSTSHGMNLIAELIADQGGVLTNALEFPTTTVPWIHRKAALTFLKPQNGVISTEAIQKNLTPKMKTILTSFVQYQNGFRADLEAIGRLKGNRFFVVNAAQGFGYLPIDVRSAQIDFLAANSYKWLMAGHGGGILYANEKWIRKFRPHSAGWQSVLRPELFDNRHAFLKPTAARYEYGSPPFPSIFAIGAAIEYISELGIENVWQRIKFLTDVLIGELKKRGFQISSPLDLKMRSGIVVFGVKNAVKLTNQLLARRFYVSPRGEGIRVAPHLYNTEAEIHSFIKALGEEMRNL